MGCSKQVPLDKFDNEHTRTHRWVEYQIYVLQHPLPFFVRGPRGLSTHSLTLRAQQAYDSFDTQLLPIIRYMMALVELETFIMNNY